MSRRAVPQPEPPSLAPLPPPNRALSRGWQVGLVAIVCAYVTLSLVHLSVVPVLPRDTGSLINAPDERAHVGYLGVLAEEHRLPTRDDAPVTYEWHQPPLYYLAALPLYEAAGDQGARFASLICGALAIIVLFAAVRRLCPDDPVLAATAAGFAALLPMRQAVYAAVGNDAMLELWFSLALYQVVLAFTNSLSTRRAATIGVVIALAILTKATGALLVPIFLVAAVAMWRNGEPARSVIQGTGVAAGAVLILTCGWYARNWGLYHELTPVKAFVHEFEHTARAADFIGQPLVVDPVSGDLTHGPPMTVSGYVLLVEAWTARTFIAAYTPLPLARIGQPKFVSPLYYVPYLLLGCGALAGLVRLHFRRAEFTALQRAVIGLCWVTAGLVAVSFAGFVWTFFQAQGRYLYPAMLPLAFLTALGFRGVVPTAVRDRASAAALVLMTILSACFVFGAVVPAYT